jgi:hypothetical protein
VARLRIRALETELAAHRRAAELLKELVRPKGRLEAIVVNAGEGLPVGDPPAGCWACPARGSTWRAQQPRRKRPKWASSAAGSGENGVGAGEGVDDVVVGAIREDRDLVKQVDNESGQDCDAFGLRRAAAAGPAVVRLAT